MDQRSYEFETETSRGRPPLMCWGALLAGLLVTLGVLWFLHLLGLAIGVTVIDLADPGAGIAWYAVAWMVVSALAALLLGAMCTSRLTGEPSETVGMLHGVCLWAASTVVLVIFGSMGLSALARGSFAMVETGLSAASSGVAHVASGAETTGSALIEERRSPIVDEIRAGLKSRASEMLARAGDEDNRSPSPQEIERSIEQMDEQTLRTFAARLLEGETDAAVEELAERVELSERDLERLATGVSREVQELLGTADDQQPLAADIRRELKGILSRRLADLDQSGGTEVTAQDLRSTLDDLDAEVMQTIALRLLRGDAENARNALVANTSLTRQEADALIAGVRTEVEQAAGRYEEQLEDIAETAGAYGQGALWTSVVLTTLGLGAAVLGGAGGAQSTRVVRTEVRAARHHEPV